MSEILNKKQMSEEDIKLHFITPAILDKGWKEKLTMETAVKFTDGKINLKGNLVVREKPKKADYLLYMSKNNPIAVVEAKDNNHSVSHGHRRTCAGNALPVDFENMSYPAFLEKRRKLMAEIVKRAYQKLCE